MPQDYIENFRALSRITEIAYQHTITRLDQDSIRLLVDEFVVEFEALYVGNDIRRMNAMKVDTYSIKNMYTADLIIVIRIVNHSLHIAST